MGTRDGGVLPASQASVIDAHHEQLAELQRRTRALPDTTRRPYEATVHFYGVFPAAVSPAWPVPSTGRLFVVRFLPTTVGASAITVKVYKSGAALTPLGAVSTTITLPGSSTAEVSVQFDVAFLRIGGFPADTFAVETVTTSAGWEDLIVLGDFG